MNPVYVVLLGKPGSGKGFLSELLIEQGLEAGKIVPGKTYRKWVAECRPRWEYILDCMENRRLVDDETTIRCIEKDIKENLIQFRLLFFDGFPRNLIQFKAFVNMSERNKAELHFVYIDRTDEFCRRKADERTAKDIAAGREPRPDSNPEAVQKGLDQFYKHTLPVIEEVQEEDHLIHHLKTDDDLLALIPRQVNFYALFQLSRFKKTVENPVGSRNSSHCDAPCHE